MNPNPDPNPDPNPNPNPNPNAYLNPNQVDAADADGRSALWLAVRARQAGLLAALLKGGASPSREDGRGVPL